MSTTGSMADSLGLHNPLRYRGYVYDHETALYYLQSRYYDPELGRFINADAFASTGTGLLGYNMFAYCGNNPISRIDSTGCVFATLAAIGISAVASVAASAISALISGEEFTAGDAIGAAIAGAATTAMIIVGIPPVIANPVATFCGGVIGQYVDNDFSKEAFDEVVTDTFTSAGSTILFAGAGKIASKYVNTCLNGKYMDLGVFDKFVRNIVYQPKYLNESSISTIIAENVWDSVKSIVMDVID